MSAASTTFFAAATALNIEVYKNEGFNNDEEEVEYQNFLEIISL